MKDKGPWTVWLFEPSTLMQAFNVAAVRRGNGEHVPELDFEATNRAMWECVMAKDNPQHSHRPCMQHLDLLVR